MATRTFDEHAPLIVRLRDSTGDEMVISVSGEVDADNSEQMRQQIIDLFDRSVRHIALDLSELSFLGSAGVQALLECRDRAERRDCSFEISRAHDNVRQVLVICNLTELLRDS